MSAVTSSKYVLWDDPSVESGAGPEEDREIDEIARLVNLSQQRVFDKHQRAFTGTHVKTHGVVKGTMTVLQNLPKEFSQSLFANADKTYPIAMRFSTESMDIVPDTVPQPRGVGVKVFNVQGTKLQGQHSTHDFEFNNAPVIELANAKVCREIMDLRLRFTDQKEHFQELKKRKDFSVQDARNHLPNQHIFCQRQYSQAAFRFGNLVAKFALTPISVKTNEVLINSEKDDENITLRKGLIDFLQQHSPLEFDFQVQLLQNVNEQSVEDARIEWNEEKYPFISVARISIPNQDPFLPSRLNFWRDQLIINPWLGLADLQPLGSINRVRKGVYKASAAFRRRANGHQEAKFVDNIDQIPDN